jgi:hypothetical protein
MGGLSNDAEPQKLRSDKRYEVLRAAGIFNSAARQHA